ncbi:MAG: branched-chain amino acid ABC transporter substrate-binding protein [Candidatus Limnocylindria bacterium]
MQRRWLSSAAIAMAAALVASACGVVGGPGGAAPASITIVSSLPLTGPSRTQTVTIVNAIEMALDEVGRKIGNTTIEYQSLDDATAARQSWDAAQEAENAGNAARDASVVAYIGTFNSGAAQVAIPILCAAGLAMISPANTYAGLTKAGKGEPDEPGKYYPGGCARNYTRVVPADDLQGAVGAAWAKELGATKVFVTHDNELYGKGLADVFRTEAEAAGLEIVGNEGAPKADNYRALANKIRDSGADLVYYGGITDNNPAILVRDVKAVIPNIKLMGPDGIAESVFLETAGAAAEGMYITFGGVPPSEYTGKAKEWADQYRAKFGGDPEVYAIYGYEAAKVVIAALQKAGNRIGDRAAVREAMMGTRNFEGVLGTWSFNEEGDTSLTTMAGMQIRSGEFAFVKLLGGQ